MSPTYSCLQHVYSLDRVEQLVMLFTRLLKMRIVIES